MGRPKIIKRSLVDETNKRRDGSMPKRPTRDDLSSESEDVAEIQGGTNRVLRTQKRFEHARRNASAIGKKDKRRKKRPRPIAESSSDSDVPIDVGISTDTMFPSASETYTRNRSHSISAALLGHHPATSANTSSRTTPSSQVSTTSTAYADCTTYFRRPSHTPIPDPTPKGPASMGRVREEGGTGKRTKEGRRGLGSFSSRLGRKGREMIDLTVKEEEEEGEEEGEGGQVEDVVKEESIVGDVIDSAMEPFVIGSTENILASGQRTKTTVEDRIEVDNDGEVNGEEMDGNAIARPTTRYERQTTSTPFLFQSNRSEEPLYPPHLATILEQDVVVPNHDGTPPSPVSLAQDDVVPPPGSESDAESEPGSNHRHSSPPLALRRPTRRGRASNFSQALAQTCQQSAGRRPRQAIIRENKQSRKRKRKAVERIVLEGERSSEDDGGDEADGEEEEDERGEEVKAGDSSDSDREERERLRKRSRVSLCSRSHRRPAGSERKRVEKRVVQRGRKHSFKWRRFESRAPGDDADSDDAHAIRDRDGLQSPIKRKAPASGDDQEGNQQSEGEDRSDIYPQTGSGNDNDSDSGNDSDPLDDEGSDPEVGEYSGSELGTVWSLSEMGEDEEDWKRPPPRPKAPLKRGANGERLAPITGLQGLTFSPLTKMLSRPSAKSDAPLRIRGGRPPSIGSDESDIESEILRQRSQNRRRKRWTLLDSDEEDDNDEGGEVARDGPQNAADEDEEAITARTGNGVERSGNGGDDNPGSEGDGDLPNEDRRRKKIDAINFQRIIIILAIRYRNGPWNSQAALGFLDHDYFREAWFDIQASCRLAAAELELPAWERFRTDYKTFPTTDRIDAVSICDDCNACRRDHTICYSYSDVWLSGRYDDLTFAPNDEGDLQVNYTLGPDCFRAWLEAGEMYHIMYREMLSFEEDSFAKHRLHPRLKELLHERRLNIDAIVDHFKDRGTAVSFMKNIRSKIKMITKRRELHLPRELRNTRLH